LDPVFGLDSLRKKNVAPNGTLTPISLLHRFMDAAFFYAS